MRVLDNLSTGFVENLCGVDVELQEGSICDRDAVAKAMAGVRHVVHLAARISVPASVADPLGYDETNVRGFLHVLEAARAEGVERVVYASSCAVYGSLPGLPKTERSPLAPESPYASSKLSNEAYGVAYARTMGVPTVGLRYFNVFGPRQDPSGPYGAVIPKFVEWALAGKPLVVFGDGEQGRDFIHVHDVARANLLATTAEGAAGGVFNIGTGRMLTINRLTEAVRDEVGAIEVQHEPERAGDVRHSRADASAAAAWGFEATEDFDAGLAATVRWFQSAGS